MAYTIYFGYLPKSSLIVDRSTNIVVDSDLSKLYSFEVAQISFTNNGGASFIVPQTQHKIDHMAFACYNAFFIKTENYDDNGIYHGYSITTYDITDIAYTSATNVKISGMLSPYNLALSMSYASGGENTYMNFSELRGFNGFIERGYSASSIINPLNQKVNFSSDMSTDLYCLPPFQIRKEILKSSVKAKYDIAKGSQMTATVKARANNVFNNCLWELAYILNTVTYSKSTGADPLTIKYQGTQQKGNDNAYIDLPYFVICKPISREPIINGGVYSYKIYSPIEQDFVEWGDEYNAIVESYKPYVLSKQISFVPPFIMDDANDLIEFIDTGDVHTMRFTFGSDNAYAKDQDFRYYNAFDNTDVANCIKIEVFPSVYDGEFDLSALTGLYQVTWAQTFTPSDLSNIDTNPYVNLHTQELHLSDNQGNNYTYPLINLGAFSELHIKTYIAFNLGNMFTYSTIDTYYLTNSVLNDYMGKDYRGLFTSFNNSILFSQDLLQEYMAQNKNFFNVRDLETSTYAEKWLYKTMLSVGMNVISENIVGTLGSLLTSYGGYLDYNTKITKENYQLNNLQSAPDSVKGSNNDTLFYSNNRKMGIYLDLYVSDDLTRNALFNDFIKYGIYINRYVSDNALRNYLTITDTAFDRKHIKYFKGNLNLQPYYVYDTKDYQYHYLCVDTCLKKLEKDLMNGCYVFKDTTTEFKPYKSDSELSIYYNYLNNDLFRGV